MTNDYLSSVLTCYLSHLFRISGCPVDLEDDKGKDRRKVRSASSIFLLKWMQRSVPKMLQWKAWTQRIRNRQRCKWWPHSHRHLWTPPILRSRPRLLLSPHPGCHCVKILASELREHKKSPWHEHWRQGRQEMRAGKKGIWTKLDRKCRQLS